jgi:hypothetical protein
MFCNNVQNAVCSLGGNVFPKMGSWKLLEPSSKKLKNGF